jgi:hypothetical protein
MIIVESVDVIDCFLNKTRVSFYDDLINDHPLDPGGKYSVKEYMKFEKGLDSYIETLTGDEYIQKCSSLIFHKSVDQTLRGVNYQKVSDYANLMKDGTKFPLPYLNLAEHQQEGRHRMLALKEAFGKDAKGKVLVVIAADPTDEEIRDYARRKWGEAHVSWGFNYCKAALRKRSEE